MKKTTKILLFIICMFMFIPITYAKNVITLQECEYTDEFKEYMKLSKKEKEKYVIIPRMCKGINSNLSTNLKSGKLGDASASKFDLRELGKVTNVKDQAPSGSCWAFASAASIESNLLTNGFGQSDLSEAHMELSTQNTFSLNRTSFNRKFNDGGNYLLSSVYVMNSYGAVYEDDFPFSIEKDLINNKSTTYDTNIVTSKKQKINIGNVAWVLNDENNSCSKNNNTTSQIKNLLVNNGAVAASIYWDNKGEEIDEVNYDNNEFTIKGDYIKGPYYYYTTSGEVNHAVTIVGWDDTISKENFSEKNRPLSDGAWIVKNSWGAKVTEDVTGVGKVTQLVGDEGYYYVSYEDKNICSFISSFQNTSFNLSNNTYYYDELGYAGDLKASADIYAGRKFKKNSTTNEKLDKVSFFNGVSGAEYKVYYANNGGFNNLKEIASGTADYIGYISVKPTNEIIIDNDFSIVVLYKKFGSYSYVPVSTKTTGGYLWDNNVIKSNVDYVSTDNKNWADLSNMSIENSTVSANLTIRAYTTNTTNSSHDSSNNTEDKNIDEPNNSNDTVVEVKENSNNDTSYLNTDSDNVKNPSTTGTKNYLIVLGLLLMISIIVFGSFKLKKVKKGV